MVNKKGCVVSGVHYKGDVVSDSYTQLDRIEMRLALIYEALIEDDVADSLHGATLDEVNNVGSLVADDEL